MKARGIVLTVHSNYELNKSPVTKDIAAAREMLRDPNYLPTHSAIQAAFGTTTNPLTPDWCRDWWDFCRGNYRDEEGVLVFELLNEEYLEALVDYLVERFELYEAGTDFPIKILEVGAGNGRLTHFLSEKLEQRAPGLFNIVATDSGEWRLQPDFEVEKLNHQQALEKYRPHIVIMSWMPANTDLTKDFRACDSVWEYILIGEADSNTCGHPWETWGTVTIEMWNTEQEEDTPLHEAEGFLKVDLNELSYLQMCRSDTPINYDGSISSTVSFRRLETS